MKEKVRNSNMELLRIISILLIIVFHFAYKGRFDFAPYLSFNKLLVKTCWFFGELGVNLFILTTGYFMIQKDFKIKKVLKLIFQVLFYYLLTTLFGYIIGYIEFENWKDIFLLFFPVILNKYWFITAYILLYLFTPYLNKFVSSIDKNTYKKFLILSLFIYSVIPTIFGIFFNSTEDFLYYNRFIWLIIVYFIGGYIKLYSLPFLDTKKKSLNVSIIIFILMICSILFIEKFDKIFLEIGISEVAYLWTPNNIFMVLLSLGVFNYFVYLELKENNFINKIASTTLGIYLLHDGVLTYWFWDVVFKNSTYQNSPYLLFYIIKTILIIFIIGVIIDLIRQLLEKVTIDKILYSNKFNNLLSNTTKTINTIFNLEENEIMKKNKKEIIMLDTFLDKIYDNKIINYILSIIFSLSFSMLSFFQIVKYEKIYIIITLIVSLVLSFIFIRKTIKDNYDYFKENKIITILLMIASLIIVVAMHRSKGIPNTDMTVLDIPIRIFRLRGWLLAFPAMFYLIVWCYRKITNIIKEFWNSLDEKDKKFYKYATIISSIVIAIVYFFNSGWFNTYDVVYSIDSGWLCENLLPKLEYYDIRHPILGFMVFPIWGLINGSLSLIVPSHLLKTIVIVVLQIINVQFLIMSSLMIKKLTKSKWSFYLFLASAPVLLFSLFFEKYQLCMFLVLLYTYFYCNNIKSRETTLVLAAGAMPTSILIYIKDIFTKEPIKEKMINIFKLAIIGLGIIVCLGRVHMLVPENLIGELSHMQTKFAGEPVTVKESIISYTNMIHGSFLTLDTKINDKYNWVKIMDKVSVIGIIVFVIMMIGAFKNRKDKFTQSCVVWTIVSIMLIIVAHWSVHESPLFSLYFLWAFIPLFQKGLDVLIDKFKWNDKYVYYPIIFIMLVINILNMLNILNFFM